MLFSPAPASWRSPAPGPDRRHLRIHLISVENCESDPLECVLGLFQSFAAEEVDLHANVADFVPTVVRGQDVPLRSFAVQFQKIERSAYPLNRGSEAHLPDCHG